MRKMFIILMLIMLNMVGLKAADYDNYSYYLLGYAGQNATSVVDVALNDIVICTYVPANYSDLVCDPSKEVKVANYYSGAVIKTGHFEPYSNFVYDYPEFADNRKAIRLVLDEPFLVGDLDDAPGMYALDIPEATFGDAKFGSYLENPSGTALEDCIYNKRTTAVRFYVNNKTATSPSSVPQFTIGVLTKLYLKTYWTDLSHHGVVDMHDLLDVSNLGWDYVPNNLGRYYDETEKAILQKTGTQHAPAYNIQVNGDSYALEGLIWASSPQYIEPDLKPYNYGPNKRQPRSRIGDEEGWANDGTINCADSRIHVYDTPQEALADPDGAALELYCEDQMGVDLSDYLGIHCLKKEGSGYTIMTIRCGEASELGLHFEYQLVDYFNTNNMTHDSRYVTFSDIPAIQGAAENQLTSLMGRIVAKSVDAGGHTKDVTSTTSVDREPLVRILLKSENGDVLLDGYVLIHINYSPDNVNANKYPEYKIEKLEGESVTYNTTYAEFSKYILEKALQGRFGNNLQGVQSGTDVITFDDYYHAICKKGNSAVVAEDEKYVTEYAQLAESSDIYGNGYQLKLFNFGTDIDGNDGLPPIKGYAEAEKQNEFESKELGTAMYYPYGEGSGKHTFSWTLTKAELEYLLSRKKSTESSIKVTRWIAFVAKDEKRNWLNNYYYSAPYPYIWVRMTMSIDAALGLSPVNENDDVNYGGNSDISGEIDLNGNVIGNIYYNIGDENGEYSSTEGCIVLRKPSADNSMDGKDLFGEDLKNSFTGIIFMIQPSSGTIKVNAETKGNMTLKVKIGNNAPTEIEFEGKMKASFPYSVNEVSYVYVYGGETVKNAPSYRVSGDNALMIYGIEWNSNSASGIEPIRNTDNGLNISYYTLDGQKLNGKPMQKGVYIWNGKKVVL